MNNDILEKIVPRVFKIIKNLPEKMDLHMVKNILEENEKLITINNDIQKRKDTNEKQFMTVYKNLKKK